MFLICYIESDIVELLLDARADTNIKHKTKYNPLDIAIKRRENAYNIVDVNKYNRIIKLLKRIIYSDQIKKLLE